MEVLPLISCICLTRNRPVHLARAIGCFLSQSYHNKELIVVMLTDDVVSRQVVDSFESTAIRSLFVREGDLTLGALRNIAIKEAKGAFFCQWDDDDWYHCQRLEVQYNEVCRRKRYSCALAKIFLYDTINMQTYLSPIGPWANSILCRTQVIEGELQYPAWNKKEDSEFLGKLIAINQMFPVLEPSLYIYAYHGSNTWNTSHFNRLFGQGKPMPGNVNQITTAIFHNEIDNEEASRLLNEDAVLKEVDFFYYAAPQRPATVTQYLKYLTGLFTN
jgi:hypothetical protein